MVTSASDSLWAITSYYNPAGYQRRLENYRRFRANLEVPLVTVEWAVDRPFELRPDDADVVIQIRGGDVMWQKERLLNVALEALPPTCQHVAWIDCDVLFENRRWPQLAAQKLRHHPLVQLFSERANLGPDAVLPEVGIQSMPRGTRQSVAWRLRQGTVNPSDLAVQGRAYAACSYGLAWAARREVMQELGLYDACVLGGGDRILLLAALLNPQAAQFGELNDHQHHHIHAWHEAFYRRVQGRIGCVEGRLFHLWHGELENRRYDERLTILKEQRFNPQRDLAISDDHVWRWNSEKPQLHDGVRQYFQLRREDG